MVGFCESISISSSSCCIKPILQKLHITCSGDDCLSIGGCAQPLLQQCTIQVRMMAQYGCVRIYLAAAANVCHIMFKALRQMDVEAAMCADSSMISQLLAVPCNARKKKQQSCLRCLPALAPSSPQARRCGIKQYATSSTTLWSCSITGGSHGLVVCGSSQAFLEGCSITDCGQDGIVVLQQAGLHLSHSSVSGCQGPGVDVCDEGTASLKHADIKDCCGGLWLWQSASCEVRTCDCLQR